MTYKLNFKFLIKFTIVAVVVLGAIHFWHRHQAAKQAALFLHLAKTAETNKKPQEEVRYLSRYLALRPNDIDARERLGRVRYKHAQSSFDAVAAFLILEEALRREPTRMELRRFIVDVALDARVQLVPEAAGHLDDVLIKANPTDGELQRLRAVCFEASNDVVNAGHRYEKSLLLKKDSVDSYFRLAVLIRRIKEPAVTDQLRAKLEHAKAKDASIPATDVADAVIEDLLKNNGDNFRAQLAAAAYWRAFGKPAQVRAAVDTAFRLAPNEPETILARAQLDRDMTREFAVKARSGTKIFRGAWLKALRDTRAELRTLLDRGLELPTPDDEKAAKEFLAAVPLMYRARADIELDAGKLDEAESILLKGVERNSESPDLWWSLTELRIRRNNATGAADALDHLREFGLPSPLTDYLAAQIDVLREDWLDAATKLNRIHDELTGTAYVKPANLLLARCYEQIGEFDRRIDAFNRVLADKDMTHPLWLPATLGLAEARVGLGQTEAALEIYQSIAAQYPGAWLPIARIRLGQALRQSEANRNLKPVEDALDLAAQVVAPDTVELVLLKSDFLFLKKDNAGARQLLTDLQATHSDNIDVWVGIAVQDLRDQDRSQAVATLDKAKEKLGDSVTLRLARARLLIDPKATGVAEQLRTFAPTEQDTFSKVDRVRLSRGLAAIAASAGATDLAGSLLAQAAMAAPHDLDLQLKRFDRAQHAGDTAETERILEQIRRIDGEDGTNFKAAQALYQLRRAQTNPAETAALNKAGQLFDLLENERPAWSRVALGQAVVADLRKDLDKALSKYQKAVEQGEREPTIIRRMIELFFERGRFNEAQAALQKLPPEFFESTDMSRLAAEVSLMSKNPKQALTYAARAIKPGSDDYRDQLWEARFYWSAGAEGKWEAPLRKAVDGAKGDPIPLITLVELLVAAGRSEDAKAALAKYGDTVATDQRSFAKARCLHLVGRRRDADEFKEAEAYFVQACKDRPEDIRVLRAFADFLMEKGDFAGARQRWEQINVLRTANDVDRKLALMMIAICAPMDRQMDYRTARKALESIGLLDGDRLKDPVDGAKPEDLRSAATVLALQLDRASKVQAIRYLDKLETALRLSGRVPTAADHFLRGQLHASLNESDAAQKHLKLALADDPSNTLSISYYIRYVIRQNQPDLLAEAERWLKALKALQPNAARTAELEARLAVARKKPDEARRVLQPQEGKPNAPLRGLAAVYEELGLYDDAGRLYQLLGDQTKKPEGMLMYAAYLGRRRETDKALARCEEARTQNCSPMALTEAGILILYDASNPRPNDIARVMSWVTDALANPANQPAATAEFLNRQAALFNLQGRYTESIGVYERLLKINPRDSLAMNNLGYLLAAHKRDFSAAFGWLERAKGVSGPLPDLLDTEALIHLARAKAETAPAAKMQSAKAALKLLDDVEVQAPSAVTYFHLALARMAADDKPGAKQAWVEAKQRNLSQAELHPLERVDFEALRMELGG